MTGPWEDYAPAESGPWGDYPQSQQVKREVPEWAERNPNTYAAIMTALDTAPTLAGLIKSTPLGIAAGAVANPVSRAIKARINDQPYTLDDAISDAGYGASIEGAGRGVSKLLGMAIKPLLDSRALALSKAGEALKFSTSPNVIPGGERTKLAETALKYNFPLTEEGYLQLTKKIADNTAKVNDIIDQKTLQKALLTDPADIIKQGNVGDLLTRGEALRGTNPQYSNAVQQAIDDYIFGGGVKKYTPNELQLQKQNIYKELEESYGKNTLSAPKVQVKKHIAAGIKSVLESIDPNIKNLNSESSELLALSDHYLRAARRVENRDTFGLGDKIVLGIVTSNAPIAAKAASAGITLFDRPNVKLALARVMYKADTGKKLPDKLIKSYMPRVEQVIRTAAEGATYNYGMNPVEQQLLTGGNQ